LGYDIEREVFFSLPLRPAMYAQFVAVDDWTIANGQLVWGVAIGRDPDAEHRLYVAEIER
jgi:hypothetical protein